MLPAIKVKTTLPIIDVRGDTIIFREGGEDRRMFLVLEGSVKLYNERDGRETEVAIIHKHEFFGETEMYVAKPRSAAAKTVTDTKLVIIRSPRELERFATNNPWLSGKMMGTMGERLATTNELLAKKIIGSTPATGTGVETVTNIHGTDNTIRKIVRH
jgi:CRP-like cAMP-binding protein